jgi:probable selenium-dependent hydroxylase accessory protein YqeC
MLITDGDDHKVTGPPPELVDRLFAESGADYIIVEADGSRRRPLKAPAAHEPVVPSTSTTVVILMGIDAVGRPLATATHRVEEAMRFTGLSGDHVLTPSDCATILSHPDGALRVCPPGSRVVVALTRIRSERDSAAAAEIERLLIAHERIDSCVRIGAAESGVG